MPIKISGTGDHGPTHADDGRPSGHPGPAPGRFVVRSDISDLAGLLGGLQQLEHADPEKFRRVMAIVATGLQALASSEAGIQGHWASQLAGRFHQAAQSGSLATLQPLDPASGQHGLHGVQSYAAQGGGGLAQQPWSHLAQAIRSALEEVGP